MPGNVLAEMTAGAGAQKAAAVLLGVGPEVAAQIFKTLDERIVERIAAGARDLRHDPNIVPAALDAFVNAMTSHPMMIAGPKQFDTLVMELGKGSILSKGGAEGFQCLALVPGMLGEDSPGIGIAFKIADGDPDGRARAVTSVEILRQLGALTDEMLLALKPFHHRPLENWRKLQVGQIRPCFELIKA